MWVNPEIRGCSALVYYQVIRDIRYGGLANAKN